MGIIFAATNTRRNLCVCGRTSELSRGKSGGGMSERGGRRGWRPLKASPIRRRNTLRDDDSPPPRLRHHLSRDESRELRTTAKLFSAGFVI